MQRARGTGGLFVQPPVNLPSDPPHSTFAHKDYRNLWKTIFSYLPIQVGPKSVHDSGCISSENGRLTGGLSETSPVAQTLCTKAFQEETGGWEVVLRIVNKNQETSRFSIKRLTRQTNDTIQTEELFSNLENNSHGGQRLCVRTARA